MSEIYWITRLNALLGVTITIATFSFMALAASLIVKYTESDKEGSTYKKARKAVWISAPMTIVFIILSCLIPSTKEALLIYGVGGTIDYLKGNDKAKDLPEKAVLALDKYLDEKNHEKE